jgi:hypothetical protein
MPADVSVERRLSRSRFSLAIGDAAVEFGDLATAAIPWGLRIAFDDADACVFPRSE